MDAFGGCAKANQGKTALDYKGEEAAHVLARRHEAGECEGCGPGTEKGD